MNNRKPQRSNFDLICGMILGGLVVGVTLPIASDFLAEDNSKSRMSLRARSAVVHETKKTPKPKAKGLASADAQPAPLGERPEAAVPLPSPSEPDKTTSVKAETKPKIGKLEAPKKTHSDFKKIEKPKSIKSKKPQDRVSHKAPAVDSTYSETLEEISDSMDAKAVAAKNDARLLDLKDGETKAKFVTILGAQYSKDQLAQCKKRCLLKSTDPKGNVTHAVINGPAFAEVLLDHKGTINLTGVKRMVNNHEIFMVQNITFNLPENRVTARAPQAKRPVSSQNPDQAWEDLNEGSETR